MSLPYHDQAFAHPMTGATPATLTCDDGIKLAIQASAPREGSPTFVWLGGFHSDMTGTKAAALHAWADERGHGFVRFDYSGHGQSGGTFAEGDITRWRDDSLLVIDRLTAGPLVLVGSSMGGWMALLCALERPGRVAALCLVAPAPDFTEDLMWAAFDEAARLSIVETGHWMRPSAYGEDPYPITAGLIASGRRHLLLGGPIGFAGPVRILHGQRDSDVPWQRSLTLAQRLESPDVRVTFIKDGDHRLSTPGDIAALCAACAELAALV
jgi:pimeloyl-ACP methyl ester carboxylesterase